MNRKNFLLSATAAGLGLFSRHATRAEVEKNWPSRPVHLVIPSPAGGSGDALGRLVCEEFGRELGQTFVIDNRPGASMAIASVYTLQAPPDGYTFMMSGFAPLITNRFMHKKLAYDPDAFTRIGLLSATPNVVVANLSMPFGDIPGLVAYAKAHPGQLAYASYGIGTTSHLSGELLKKAAGIDLLHVPFKGSAEAVPALMGGQVVLYFDAVPSAVNAMKSGKAKVLGVTSAKRLLALPDVPTIAEQGFPDYEMNPWNGIVGPARTPAPIVQRFNAVINKTMSNPAVRQKLAAMGTEPLTGTPAEFDERLKREIPRIQALVKSAGIEPL